MIARPRTLVGALALAVLVADAAQAKGWEPAKPPYVKKGEVGASACGNKTESDAWICLVLACSRGAYRGSLYYAGGVEFRDSVRFEAGGQTATIPLGPERNGAERDFTGNLEALAPLLASNAEMTITGSMGPIPPGYGTVSAKGAKAQLARINKACGKVDVAQASPAVPPPVASIAPPPSGTAGDAAAELMFLRKQLQVIVADDAAELRRQCVTKDPRREDFCTCLSSAHVAEPSAPLAVKMSMWVLGRMFNPASSGGEAANGVPFSEPEQETLRLASQRMALRVKQCMESAASVAGTPSSSK